MNLALIWLGAGLVLVIAELATGTFYLLVLGVACLVGAALAFVDLSFWVQAVCAAMFAIFGAQWVRTHRKVSEQAPMPSLDLGQAVTWEAWIDQVRGFARVHYRGSSWDATVAGGCSGTAGEILYITAVDGGRFTVSRSK